MAPTDKRFSLPHYAGPGSGSGIIQWDDYDLPGFEDAGEQLGIPANAGLTTVILAYLTQNWIKLHEPLVGERRSFPISGSGWITTADAEFWPQIIGAEINIAVWPDESDITYGDPNVFYFGMCGTGAASDPVSAVAPILGVFRFTAREVVPGFKRIQWINHENHFLDIDRFGGITNTIWWALKPGVRGFLTLYLESVAQRLRSLTITADPFNQVFNPWLPNPWQGGDVDGGLNAVGPP